MTRIGVWGQDTITIVRNPQNSTEGSNRGLRFAGGVFGTKCIGNYFPKL